MPTLNQDDLRKLLTDTINKINGDERFLPKINDSDDNAKPFIEIDRYGYNYVCVERGQEIFRKLPFDTDELLFEVFSDITGDMARNWEIRNRKDGQTSWTLFYEKKIELMTKVKNEFGDRIKKERDRHFRELGINSA
jgi:hypothetical protein